jgi:cofilin
VAKVKPKMIYASSKDELKKRLVGIACEIQGSDQGDVEYDEVCARAYPRPTSTHAFLS